MQITDILRPEAICLHQIVADKAAAVHKMVETMDGCGVLADAAAYESDVLSREAEGSTGLGDGLAIPHAKSTAVKAPGLVAMTLREPVDFHALDGAPVNLLFMIAAPQNADNLHLQVLSRLAQLLLDHSFCHKLTQAQTAEEFLQIIALQEKAADGEQDKAQQQTEKRFRLLAVTACPSGIAHTYMAAEALADKAKEMGISIKIETDGAAGDENRLTAEEIAAADCIIIAADRAVEITRFDGKPLLRVPVTQALRFPETLLRHALEGAAPVYHAEKTEPPQEKKQRKKWTLRRKKDELHTSRLWHKFYAHLMSGIAHMLPFITGGGILIALSYILDRTNVGMVTFGTGTTLAWLTRTMGEATMKMVYPVLAGFIAVSIGDIPALLPGMMGGYLAEIGMTTQVKSQWIPSGFWGALIAGFAAGFIVTGLRRLTKKMPANLKQIKTALLYPAVSLALIGGLMVFLVNPPVGHFNDYLYQQLKGMQEGSTILLGAVLGGLMATDFGGPINKAAYLFATVALTSGRNDIMAAVMLGGMVPSIGVALACGMFRSRFTRRERQTALGNYLLGASFVTEGALPFALRDPLRVIPCCVVGSSVAGGLSIAMGCAVPAPHGGLFLLPLMDNPGGFMLALLVGSLITALLLGAFKPKLTEEQQNVGLEIKTPEKDEFVL